MKYYYKRINKGKHILYVGIQKELQGLGLIMKVNDPFALKEFIMIEFRFFWFKSWYSYEYKSY